MKLDISQALVNPNGKVIKFNDETGAVAPLTLKAAMDLALNVAIDDDLRQGIAHYQKLGDLMRAISECEGELDITSEQITLVKNRVPHRFGSAPAVVWAILQALEGKAMEAKE